MRAEPLVKAKRTLSGLSSDRVDTRVLQVVYAVDPPMVANSPGRMFTARTVPSDGAGGGAGQGRLWIGRASWPMWRGRWIRSCWGNEYVAIENRILKAKLNGCLKLSDAEGANRTRAGLRSNPR